MSAAETTTVDAEVEEIPDEETEVQEPDAPEPESAGEEPADPEPEEAPAQSKAIAKQVDRTPLSKRDPVAIAKHFFASGFFADTKSLSQAVVKIVAGEELGFGPMTSMNGINIIEGKPAMSANLIATCVKRSAHYNYRVVSVTDEEAEIRFLEDGEEIGRSKFTIAQAKRAGLVKSKSGWEKFPEAMLFARAMSQGVRWHCPEVTAGNPAYTAEELGADVDQTGKVVSLPEGSVEVLEDETPVATIDKERAEQICESFKVLALSMADIDLILGSAGIDALRARSQKAVWERVSGLTPEMADALEAEIKREAERDV